MKYQLLLPIVPVWLWQAAITAAQSGPPDFSSLPKCATAPAVQTITGSSCGITDYSCICKDSAFVDGLTSAIQKDCNADEVQQVEKFANDLCASYGITVGAEASSTATSAVASVTGNPPRTTASNTLATTATSGTAASSAATTTATQTGGAVAARYGDSWGVRLLGAVGAVAIAAGL